MDLILGEQVTKLAFLGTILTRLLTIVMAPLALGLLICSAADVKDFKTLSKIGAGFVMESTTPYDASNVPSVAAIPLNLKCTKNLGVSDKIADFVIPFGAVMNMNGTAIYEAAAASRLEVTARLIMIPDMRMPS